MWFKCYYLSGTLIKQQVYIDTAQHLEMIILAMYTCFKLQIKQKKLNTIYFCG